LGHDAFRIDGPLTIYLDPYKLAPMNSRVDLILITHDHADHCSPEDIAKIQTKNTTIVTVASAADKLNHDDIRIVIQ